MLTASLDSADRQVLEKLLGDMEVVRDSLVMQVHRKSEADFETTLQSAEKILNAATVKVDSLVSSGSDLANDQLGKSFLFEVHQLTSQMLKAHKHWEDKDEYMSEIDSDINDELQEQRRPWEDPEVKPWGQFLEDGAPGVPDSYKMLSDKYSTLQIIPEQGIELIQQWEEDNRQAQGAVQSVSRTNLGQSVGSPHVYFAPLLHLKTRS